MPQLDFARTLPADARQAVLVGRIWQPQLGPLLVAYADGHLFDLSKEAPLCSQLLDVDEPAERVRAALSKAPRVASLQEVLANTDEATRDDRQPWLLAPCDLQVVKACGVTFVDSLLERVIEERVRGDGARAAYAREEVHELMGEELRRVSPGSPEAARLREVLVAEGAWSQYLEVGLGPDAEVFTKCAVLAAVGTGASIGLHPRSQWSNSEPEVVLAVNSRGEPVGATLGNDLNLRDFEGRSALLLGKAKDNNASCSIGPFIRLFDSRFGMRDVRSAEMRLRVEGTDGFALNEEGAMAKISRDPSELILQAAGPYHQYPDGFMLFLGTPFSPHQDRRKKGMGFTHEVDDVVSISSERLGMLVNRIDTCDRVAPWTFGIKDLLHSMMHRSGAVRVPSAWS
jgi:fumarylacetoacetate (FAA) hydrolase family protein